MFYGYLLWLFLHNHSVVSLLADKTNPRIWGNGCPKSEQVLITSPFRQLSFSPSGYDANAAGVKLGNNDENCSKPACPKQFVSDFN
jgi:hypothetical protein